MALRAVLLLNVSADGVPEVEMVNPYPEGDDVLEQQMQAFLAGFKSSNVDDYIYFKSHWKELIAIRNLASEFTSHVSKQPAVSHRYTEPQITYHYTKDKAVLEAEVQRFTSTQ
ncbi:hypothetical protein HK102_013237 [Quaeritorhiza haematococci]|nr:hypothetical protein HK102_013237 [Quaeritorhiza haematococci]